MKTTEKIITMVCLCLIAYASPAGESVIPWDDDFDNYTNNTPLINGTNGWYASSGSCIVQTNVSYSIRAAMIPVDCTLSNRFQQNANTNVWIQMYIRPCLYDGQTNPVVDNTNVAAMFYINTDGYFVVHNGPATNPGPTNSQSWVTLTTNAAGDAAAKVIAGTWTNIDVFLDYLNTNWTLYAGGITLMTNIEFIKTSITNFSGFDIYNGASTSYMDNASVASNSLLVLSISVSPSTWTVGTVATGTVQMSSAANKISVTNNGSVTETFTLKIADEDDKGEWTHSSLTNGAAANVYVLSGIFCAGINVPAQDSFNQAGNNDVLTTIRQTATATQFAYVEGTATGENVSADDGRSLWLRLDTPTAGLGRVAHKITVRVGCIQP